MRAREFINEDRERLPSGSKDPLAHAFYLPGIRNNDSYRTYRLGTAIARARADASKGTEHFPAWDSGSAFGENSVIVGANDSIEGVIDQALAMTGYGGGKVAVGSAHSHEPTSVNEKSPVVAFKGYPK